MLLTVNGQPMDLPDGLTLSDLLARLGLQATPAATEVNRRLVTRAARPDHALAPGDTVEIVTLVGGG